MTSSMEPSDRPVATVRPSSDPQPLPADSSPAVGSLLGRYRVIGPIGTDGNAEVFEAEDPVIGRRAAIKLLPGSPGDRMSEDRFVAELRAGAAVNHPNVVTVYDCGRCDGGFYIAMELMNGGSAKAAIAKQGRFEWRRAVRIAGDACRGLEAVHAAGMLHRDVKPSNILLSEGPAKLADFGLAKAGSPERSTRFGAVVGTPAYMSPEQCRGELPDQRSDVYSMGATLHALLTGRPPYPDAGDLPATLFAHCMGPVPDPRAVVRDVPAGCAAVVAKAMAKQRRDRHQTVAALRADLEALLTEPLSGASPAAATPRRFAPRRGLAAVATVVVVALAATAIARLGRDEPTNTDNEPLDDATALAAAKTKSPKPKPAPAAPGPIHPAAVLPFEERGSAVREYGAKLTDIVFAKLSAAPNVHLVERESLKKALDEQELSLTGAVKPEDAVKVGRLTGAKFLITGSVLQVDKRLYLVAKLIGTENGRVLGCSVDGKSSDELAPLAEQLAAKIAETILNDGGKLVPASPPVVDRLAALKQRLGKGPRPTVWIKVVERHMSQAVIDPAVETELQHWCRECGFEVIDPVEGSKARADVIITGEAFSEFAGSRGNLVSVRARAEIKAIDRKTDKILAADRQTEVVLGLSELIAGKSALQEAGAAIAARLLPALVGK